VTPIYKEVSPLRKKTTSYTLKKCEIYKLNNKEPVENEKKNHAYIIS